MNDDNHETRDEYEDRKEQHEAASEIDAFRASCTHIRVIYRPVGGNAEGWRPVWVCERCCAKFVPESQVNMAFRAADLRGAQLLMVGSQLADDPKMDHRDRADPRWTPTLHEAWVQREENKRLLSSVDGYRRDIDNCLTELKHKNQVLRDRWKEHSAAVNRQLANAWNDGAEEGMNAFADDIRPPTGPEVERVYLKNPHSRKPERSVMEDRKPIHEIGRWCYRGWVRCESCEVQQRHPVGAESRADFECEHCGATLRWTDEDETPKGAKSWLWRVVE